MKINNSIQFKGIHIKPGGIDYVRNEGGETAVNILHSAVNECVGYKWKLCVSEQGYSLTSPTTQKTYTGPFSVKKLFKSGWLRKDVSKLVIRMDKSNRIKFPVIVNVLDLAKIYSKIKKSNGIQQMIMLLSVLEGRSIL